MTPGKNTDSNKKRRDDLRKIVLRAKWNGMCKECGETHPACLDFHHRNREEKKENVGTMAGKNRSKKALLEEIAKCDLLCANCHRKLHHEEKLRENA